MYPEGGRGLGFPSHPLPPYSQTLVFPSQLEHNPPTPEKFNILSLIWTNQDFLLILTKASREPGKQQVHNSALHLRTTTKLNVKIVPPRKTSVYISLLGNKAMKSLLQE